MIEIADGKYVNGDFTLNANFKIAAGSCVGVLGASGAGKSTLLSIIAGFEQLHSGRIILNQQDATKSRADARPVSMVFQDHNCFAHLNAWNNVALGIAGNLKLSPQQKLGVDDALKRVGIFHLAQKKPGEMSGGERQRIAIARVLVRNRPIVLLDEPFAALGPALRKDMLQLIKELQIERGLTVMMVTHQPEDARLVCDHILFIDPSLNQVRTPLATQQFFKLKNDAALQDYLGGLPTTATTATAAAP